MSDWWSIFLLNLGGGFGRCLFCLLFPLPSLFDRLLGSLLKPARQRNDGDGDE